MPTLSRLFFPILFFVLAISLSSGTEESVEEKINELLAERARIEEEISLLEKKLSLENKQVIESGDKVEKAKPFLPEKDKGFSKVTLMYLWDSREYSTYSFMIGPKQLPYEWSFFGFTDFHGEQGGEHGDAKSFFSEYRFSKPLSKDFFKIEGLGFQTEYNDFSGSGNSLLRFGLTYKKYISLFEDNKGWMQLRFFPFETDGSGQQFSTLYFIPINQWVSLSGFIDLNIDESQQARWVIEPGFTVHLDDRLKLLFEYRYNGYEVARQAIRGSGVAFGVAYVF